MLFSSSLVAIVGAGDPPALSPRKLQIINTKRQTVVCELNFPSKVLSVLMNRKRMVVVLEGKIHIYDLSSMKAIHSIETGSNPQGIAALSNTSISRPHSVGSSAALNAAFDGNHGSGLSSLLVYPGAADAGSVQIFDTQTLQSVSAIQAHRTKIARLAFNSDGTLLATASDRGTIIRIFEVATGKRLYQFRRGSYAAIIHCLIFSADSRYLCVSSDTDTVHIFRLDASDQEASGSLPTTAEHRQIQESADYNFGDVVNAVNASAVLRLGESLLREGIRHFAHLKLPSAHLPSLVAISPSSGQVMVATADGQFLFYSLPVISDSAKSGERECQLLCKYSFNPRDFDLASQQAYSSSNYSL